VSSVGADNWFGTRHFDETNQQKDGTIKWATHQPNSLDEWILQGPHIGVATPFSKSPRVECSHRQDYNSINLRNLAEVYVPRSNYMRATDEKEFAKRIPAWGGRPVTSFFRLAYREMLGLSNERSLIAAIIPPGPGHVHTVVSLAFKQPSDLACLAGLVASLPYDGILRMAGKGHLHSTDAARLPFPDLGPLKTPVMLRALRLNCLTRSYAPLWSELFSSDFTSDRFTKDDPRLQTGSHLTPEWSWDTPLRTPYARRQALVELDVLAALALGLTLEELLTLYRVQFAVLQQYERDTWYDARGEIVFTNNRGLSDIGLDRKMFNELRHAQPDDDLPDWAKSYRPPFDKCEREADLSNAYNVFCQRLDIGPEVSGWEGPSQQCERALV